MRSRVLRLLAVGLLVVINIWLYHELFYTEFFDNFQSNESMMAVIGAFLRDHPGARWFPLWNAGLPIEYTYALGVPAATAVMSSASGESTQMALHQVAALALVLFPALWYWVSRRLGAPFGQALTAAAVLAFATLSSVASAEMATDLPHRTDSRYIRDVVVYGDIAHPAALMLAGAAIACLLIWLDNRKYRWFATAVVLSAAAILTNGFGTTALILGAFCAALSTDAAHMRRAVLGSIAMGALAYLCSCALYTPSLAATISRNSQMVGGDFRFRPATALLWLAILGGMAAIRFALRRRSRFERFAALTSWLFGAIVLVFFRTGLAALPQPPRYHLEWNVALALLVAALIWLLPAKARIAMLAGLVVLAVPQAARIRSTAGELFRPVDIRTTHEYDEATWIRDHVGSGRVFAGGDLVFWMNLFTPTPQLSGGHDPYAPNFIQRVAVFTIFSGLNAGARDAEVSTLWMKAFGTRAVTVPRAGSDDRYHQFPHPDKFEGVLPRLREVKGHAIYAVPARSDSLAWIVPRDAVVRHAPVHGLDVGELTAYVRALDDPALPVARTRWESTDRARINATLARGQVVSVQTTYDPGWTARVGGANVPVRPDGLGLIVVEPGCEGTCDIDLRFTGGTERAVCLAVSLCSIAGVLLWPVFRRPRATIQA